MDFVLEKAIKACLINPSLIKIISSPYAREKSQKSITNYAFTYDYDVSSRGGGGFKMLTVADNGGEEGYLRLADVSNKT